MLVIKNLLFLAFSVTLGVFIFQSGFSRNLAKGRLRSILRSRFGTFRLIKLYCEFTSFIVRCVNLFYHARSERHRGSGFVLLKA